MVWLKVGIWVVGSFHLMGAIGAYLQMREGKRDRWSIGGLIAHTSVAAWASFSIALTWHVR